MWKISTVETIKHWRKRLNKTPEDEKISNGHRLAGLILWKWLYYQKQSRVSMQSPSKS
jgi:hypothetical protein